MKNQSILNYLLIKRYDGNAKIDDATTAPETSCAATPEAYEQTNIRHRKHLFPSDQFEYKILPKRICLKSSGDDKQLVLDFGQKVIGNQLCEKCGMVYDIDSSIDKKMHEEYHSKHTAGAEDKCFQLNASCIRLIKSKMEIINAGDGAFVFCVRKNTTASLRKRIENIVIEHVNVELGYAQEFTHDFWTDTNSRHAWIFVKFYCNEYFIAGLTLIEILTKAQLLESGCIKLSELCNNGDDRFIGVNRIWVHPRFRRSSVATKLLDCVRRNFSVAGCIPRENIAFSEPTSAGLHFAKSYNPSSSPLIYSLLDL